MRVLSCTSEMYYIYIFIYISLLSHLGYKSLITLLKSTESNEQIIAVCIKIFNE